MLRVEWGLTHGKFPATYARLAMDEKARFGHKPVTYKSWGYPNASRYVRKFQSRRSFLVWKIHGALLDGFSRLVRTFSVDARTTRAASTGRRGERGRVDGETR